MMETVKGQTELGEGWVCQKKVIMTRSGAVAMEWLRHRGRKIQGGYNR